MENKNRKTITLLMVFSVIFTVIGTTLAYWNWETTEGELTGVTFTVTSEFSCSADGGDELNSNNVMLAPTDCTNSNYAMKREITLDRTMGIEGMKIYTDLWLDVKTLESGLAGSENFKWVFTQDGSSCNIDNAISYGTFTGLETNDKVLLLDGEVYTDTEEDTYYLYIWLDKEETSRDTMNQNFEFKLGGECSNMNTKLEAPVLDDGLIPVTIDNDGTVTTIASTNSYWYNYDEKQYANAVLVRENADGSDVDSKSRSYYQENLEDKVVVNQEDILAYFVWIPRYAYKIWTTGVSAKGSEVPIDISWERADDRYLEGTQVNEYRTHPAFWRDVDGDRVIDKGETIAGIWVAKFETTGTADSPTVLPNVTTLRSQTISNQFKTALKFAGGSMSNNQVVYPESDSTYGLSGNLESHMIKNSEWGALAYLSHSQYGIETEVRYNNYNGGTSDAPVTMTGCGAAAASTVEASSTCGHKYGTVTSYPQSTNGNISGIFDTAGGSWERVMGNRANTEASGGFDSGFFNQASNQKYYDLYTAAQFSGNVDTDYNSCTIETCGGHALSETKSWYGDYAYFVISSSPWFFRGGDYGSGAYAGAFYFYGDGADGDSEVNVGFRAVLAPKSVSELQLVS